MKVTYQDIFPPVIEEDTLYISCAYQTTAHLCASGCGFRVVLPLGKGGWELIDEQDVTLHPSIHVPKCNSHYWIRNGRIQWARQLDVDDIEEFIAADQQAYNSELQKKNLIGKVMASIRRILRRH